MWSEESPDDYCIKNEIGGSLDDQVACQKKCKADSDCVGIAWSTTRIPKYGLSWAPRCYLCKDDGLSNACCNKKFHWKGEQYIACLLYTSDAADE